MVFQINNQVIQNLNYCLNTFLSSLPMLLQLPLMCLGTSSFQNIIVIIVKRRFRFFRSTLASVGICRDLELQFVALLPLRASRWQGQVSQTTHSQWCWCFHWYNRQSQCNLPMGVLINLVLNVIPPGLCSTVLTLSNFFIVQNALDKWSTSMWFCKQW